MKSMAMLKINLTVLVEYDEIEMGILYIGAVVNPTC